MGHRSPMMIQLRRCPTIIALHHHHQQRRAIYSSPVLAAEYDINSRTKPHLNIGTIGETRHTIDEVSSSDSRPGLDDLCPASLPLHANPTRGSSSSVSSSFTLYGPLCMWHTQVMSTMGRPRSLPPSPRCWPRRGAPLRPSPSIRSTRCVCVCVCAWHGMAGTSEGGRIPLHASGRYISLRRVENAHRSHEACARMRPDGGD